jgi:tol-pal system protein YbgF
MRPRAIVLAASLVFAGCATSGDMKDLQDQIADLHDQIAELKKQASSKEEVQRLNQSLANQGQALLKSNADLTVKVSEIDDKMQNVAGQVEQTNYRIDRLVQQVTQNERDIAELRGTMRSAAPPAAEGGSPIQEEVTVSPPVETSEDPLSIYRSAYSDYHRGNFDLAIQGFTEFLRNNPGSDLADNAAYWIGESRLSQKKYAEAIQQFDSVIKNYSRSDKVPAALLKKGYAYMELGEKAQGIVQLQYVVHEHPRSNEASLARQRLKTLGIETQ